MSTAMTITDQILARLSVGDSLRDSVDGVLGEGTYERCARELHTTATTLGMNELMREHGLTRAELDLAPPTLAISKVYARTCPRCRRVHVGECHCQEYGEPPLATAIRGNDDGATVEF